MPALRKRLGEAYLWQKDLGGFGNKVTEESLDWLMEFGRSQNIVIMCSKSDPFHCHRQREIAARLWDRTPPVPLIHLDSHGNQMQAFLTLTESDSVIGPPRLPLR